MRNPKLPISKQATSGDEVTYREIMHSLVSAKVCLENSRHGLQTPYLIFKAALPAEEGLAEKRRRSSLMSRVLYLTLSKARTRPKRMPNYSVLPLQSIPETRFLPKFF